MIYANMAQFQIPSVADVVKVGDTVADIQEGKNAGILSLGVLEGSSVLGLTQEEYEALPPQDRERVLARAKETFLAAGGRRRFVKPVPAAPVAGGTGEGGLRETQTQRSHRKGGRSF